MLDLEGALPFLERPVGVDLPLDLLRTCAGAFGQQPPFAARKTAVLSPIGRRPIQRRMRVGAEFAVGIVIVIFVKGFLDLLEPILVEAGEGTTLVKMGAIPDSNNYRPHASRINRQSIKHLRKAGISGAEGRGGSALSRNPYRMGTSRIAGWLAGGLGFVVKQRNRAGTTT